VRPPRPPAAGPRPTTRCGRGVHRRSGSATCREWRHDRPDGRSGSSVPTGHLAVADRARADGPAARRRGRVAKRRSTRGRKRWCAVPDWGTVLERPGVQRHGSAALPATLRVAAWRDARLHEQRRAVRGGGAGAGGTAGCRLGARGTPGARRQPRVRVPGGGGAARALCTSLDNPSRGPPKISQKSANSAGRAAGTHLRARVFVRRMRPRGCLGG